MTKCEINGPAGSGKTTLRHLMLRKGCPVTHESTDILADVDLISPDVDLVDDLINVRDLPEKQSVWVEIKDQKMHTLIANSIFVKSQSESPQKNEESHQESLCIDFFMVMKQLRKLLKKKLEKSKSCARKKRKHET